MKRHASKRGSAIILALVIVIIAAGLAGAFMSLTSQTSARHFKLGEADEAQLICDAGLETARAALLKWRLQDMPPKTGEPFQEATQYAWNKVFQHCKNRDGVKPGLGKTANARAIKEDAVARLNDLNATWEFASDKAYSYNTSNLTASIGQVDFLTKVPDQCIIDLFGINRRYGKGTFHLSLRNEDGEQHGNGFDDAVPPNGNAWGKDSAVDPISDVIDGNGQAILTVTAVLPDGTTVQVEGTVGYPFKDAGGQGAVRANGDITLNGSFAVQGTYGSVQANGNISGNGSANAVVQVSIDASGSTVGLSMQNTPKNGINSNAPPMSIEPVDIEAFATSTKPSYKSFQDRMWILPKDGGAPIWKGKGAPPTNPLDGGFDFKNGAWKLSGGKTTPANAVYYIEGDFSATGQGGSEPYSMTIIATGSIEMGGNAAFSSATTDGMPPRQDPKNPYNPIPENSLGSLLIAGQDLSLRGTGNGGVQYAGSTWANEQVEIRGNFTLNGSITAADKTDTAGSKVSSSSSLAPELTLQGNPTIIDNGTKSFPAPDPDHLNLINLHRLEISSNEGKK